jgi:hypothetical protein
MINDLTSVVACLNHNRLIQPAPRFDPTEMRRGIIRGEVIKPFDINPLKVYNMLTRDLDPYPHIEFSIRPFSGPSGLIKTMAPINSMLIRQMAQYL